MASGDICSLNVTETELMIILEESLNPPVDGDATLYL